jgi:hypothetical protein
MNADYQYDETDYDQMKFSIEERDMMFVRLISGTVGIWEYTIH